MTSEGEFEEKMLSWFRQYHDDVFPVETEETVPGFPDVLLEDHGNFISYVHHAELKVMDCSHRVTFERSQSAFYKKHPGMSIMVFALCPSSGTVYFLKNAKRVLEAVAETGSLTVDFMRLWEETDKNEKGTIQL